MRCSRDVHHKLDDREMAAMSVTIETIGDDVFFLPSLTPSDPECQILSSVYPLISSIALPSPVILSLTSS